MDKKYKAVVVIFMVYFIYEYSSPILNGLRMGTEVLGWTWLETLMHRQVIKHVLRLPIYGLTYLWIFANIPKRSKVAMWLWRAMAWLHVIFKPATGAFVLYTAGKAGMLTGFPTLSITFLLGTLLVYLVTIVRVEKYWQELAKTGEKN